MASASPLHVIDSTSDGSFTNPLIAPQQQEDSPSGIATASTIGDGGDTIPSKVIYPDILVETSSDQRGCSSSASLAVDREVAMSPSQASQELLLSIPEATAHLIDRENSVHLASGEFTLIRLTQKGDGIAVFAKVGKDLTWPLVKDSGSVKVDSSHYFFSLPVPSEIEDKEDDGRKDGEEEEEDGENGHNMVNYGVSFSATSDGNLKALDDYLAHYTSFQVQPAEASSSSLVIADLKAKGGEGEGEGGDIKEAVYWTTLAPNVEDYSSVVARGIAAGTGQIIKVMFQCSDLTVDQINRGNQFMMSRIQPQEAKAKISPAAMRRIQRVRTISQMSEKLVTGILSGVIKVAAFVTRPIINSRPGQILIHLLPGEIALASLDAFEKLFDAIEVAGRNVLSTTSTVTTGLVSQRYGDEAAEFTQQGISSAGHFLTTAWTVSKIRKAFNPSLFVKSAAKAANERKQLQLE